MQDISVRGSLDIQAQRFLSVIRPDKIRRFAQDSAIVLAREIAFAALYLDDSGATLGEVAGAQRRGNCLFEGDDQQTVIRSDPAVLRCHVPLSSKASSARKN